MAGGDALDAAARALARRDRSRRELLRRLEARGFDERSRSEAVSRLEELGIVDDARLARNRAAALADRGYGDRAIAAKLAAERLDREAVEVALSELEPETARALRQAAGARVREPAQLAARLRRRGFGSEAVESALARLDGLDEPELR